MSKKQKKQLIKILIGAAIYVIAMLLPITMVLKVCLYIIGYLIVGGDIVLKAVKNIRKGQVFDENFLMTIATIGAFLLQSYEEGIAVMLFYQVGELFQSYAVSQSRKSISSLMAIRPDVATVLRDGEEVEVDPEEVAIGETIIVRPGEKVPLDGKVKDGISSLDTSALTGESVPREIFPGEEVISGCINISGILKISVSREYGESTVAKILDLVENASSEKAPVENFITKFARIYTPIVVIGALLLAIVPPLFLAGHPFHVWIYRALTFLVISCPCALVISIPLSFFGGIGGASKIGVLIKGSNYLEALAKTEIVVFDKTGTLTKGTFNVTSIHPVNIDEAELLKLTAYAENYSNHPISKSIIRAYGENIDRSAIKEIEEIPGHGVKAIVNDKTVYVGNAKLMKMIDVSYDETALLGTIVHTVVDGVYAGYIQIADEVKEDAALAIQKLKNIGVKRTVMLTGDLNIIGQNVAKELNLDEAYTELLPADKVGQMERLMAGKSETGKLVFVGDGINDAPVLARADIGIAMGGLGSDAAIEAADVVIMTDEPSKISGAVKIAKKTLRICKQNIIFALGVKAIVLILGAAGFASMWAAVFADVGVSIIAILNAIRALHNKE